MPTDVVMPQMGESVAEGTIVRWIKKVGDTVDRDEPLFEISTDKVDAEIPAPAAGVLTEIRHKEGETVPVNAVVAVIGQATESAPVRTPEPPAAAPVPAARPATQADGSSEPVSSTSSQPAVAATRSPSDNNERQRSSPLVRKIAKEHSVDISQIAGTGISGRVTRDDILG